MKLGLRPRIGSPDAECSKYFDSDVLSQYAGNRRPATALDLSASALVLLEPPRTSRVRGEGGFSLIEVVIALGLLASVLISVAGLFVLGNRQVYSGRNHSSALSVARQVLEEMSGWSFRQTYEGFGFDGSSAEYTIRSDVAGYATKWHAVLADDLQDAYAEIVLRSVDAAGGTPDMRDAEGIRIVVTVHWTEGKRQRSARLAMVKL